MLGLTLSDSKSLVNIRHEKSRNNRSGCHAKSVTLRYTARITDDPRIPPIVYYSQVMADVRRMSVFGSFLAIGYFIACKISISESVIASSGSLFLLMVL